MSSSPTAGGEIRVKKSPIKSTASPASRPQPNANEERRRTGAAGVATCCAGLAPAMAEGSATGPPGMAPSAVGAGPGAIDGPPAEVALRTAPIAKPTTMKARIGSHESIGCCQMNWVNMCHTPL
jgi:hypothetical protein